MWMEKIALFCLVLLAFVGTITLGIIFHEYSHYNDFREFNITNESLCGLALPTTWINWTYFLHQPAGYYSYSIYTNKSDLVEIKKYEKVEKDTELKAYLISGGFVVFFLFCYWIIIFGRYRDKEKILDQEFDSLEKDFYIHQLEEFILNHSKDNDNYDYDYDYDDNTAT